MNASDWPNPAIELARPRTPSAARLLTSGPMVAPGPFPPARTAVKPNTHAIRPAAVIGRAAGPSTAHETAKIKPVTASARLRRTRRTTLSTMSCVATMIAVLTVRDSATMCADTCPSTVA
jgi:hypothetical protein